MQRIAVAVVVVAFMMSVGNTEARVSSSDILRSGESYGEAVERMRPSIQDVMKHNGVEDPTRVPEGTPIAMPYKTLDEVAGLLQEIEGLKAQVRALTEERDNLKADLGSALNERDAANMRAEEFRVGAEAKASAEALFRFTVFVALMLTFATCYLWLQARHGRRTIVLRDRRIQELELTGRMAERLADHLRGLSTEGRAEVARIVERFAAIVPQAQRDALVEAGRAGKPAPREAGSVLGGIAKRRIGRQANLN